MSPEDKKAIKRIANRLSHLLDVTAEITEEGWKELTREISGYDVPTWTELKALSNVLNHVAQS